MGFGVLCLVLLAIIELGPRLFGRREETIILGKGVRLIVKR